MTRERFEQILFAHVSDEVVQDMLNQYVLELEAENKRLRELVTDGERHVLRILGENKRLRKFMSDILTYGYGGGFLCADGAWSCPHYQECFGCPVEEGPEKYVRRGCKWLALARELRVEVD